MSDAFVLTLDKSAPDYAVRMEGVETSKRGMAMTFSGALEMLTDTTNLTLEQRQRLAAACRRSFPRAFSFLPELSRTEFLGRLKRMAADPKLTDLRAELTALNAAANGK